MEYTDQESASGVTINDLPNEILCIILPPCGSTLLTCRRWHAIVQPILIAKITGFVRSNALRQGPYAKSLRDAHKIDGIQHTRTLNKILSGTDYICYFDVEAAGACLRIYSSGQFAKGPVYTLRYHMQRATFETNDCATCTHSVSWSTSLKYVVREMKNNSKISPHVDELIAALRHICHNLGLKRIKPKSSAV